METPQVWDNLAHQLALLCIDPKTGKVRRKQDLALATAGGALAELAIQERVSLVDGRVRVHDERPTEDPILDVMLRVLAEKPDRRPMRIVDAARKAYLKQALAELVSNGWVALTPGSGLKGDSYTILDEQRVQQIREQVVAGFSAPADAKTREAFLAGMAYELGLGRELMPEMGIMDRARAARVLRKRDWAVKAVHDVKQARAAAASAAAN